MKRIKLQLGREARWARGSFIGMTILLIISILFDILHSLFSEQLKFLCTNIDSMYLYMGLCLMAIAVALNISSIVKGVMSLMNFKLSLDILLSLAFVLFVFYIPLAIYMVDEFTRVGISSYVSVFMLLFFFSSLSRYKYLKRVALNYNFVKSGGEKSKCEFLKESKVLVNSSFNHGEASKLVYERATNRVTDFFVLSSAKTPYESLSHKVIPFVMLICITGFIVDFVNHHSLLLALASTIVCFSLCIPGSYGAAAEYLVENICRTALKFNAMICGNYGIDKFSGVTGIIIDEKELYPSESIIVHGFKTFKGNRIDEALISASALISSVNGPLKDVFSKIIKCKGKDLPKVSGLAYEDGKGLVGWVNGKRVLAGNREILKGYGVAPPTNDHEKKYIDQGNQIMYFALGGQLVSMVVLTYVPNKKLLKKIKLLEKNDISVIVRTVDCNITPELISRDFKISPGFVKVLSASENSAISEVMVGEQSDACIDEADFVLSAGSMSLVVGLCEACKAKFKLTILLVIQLLSLGIGFSLVIFLLFNLGLFQINNIEILVYAGFWALVSFIAPKFIRS